MRDMIYHNQVNAYVLNPSLANVVPKDSNDNSVIPSDMIINKYVRYDNDVNKTVYTFAPGDEFDCGAALCPIRMKKDENGNYIFI